MSEEWFVIANPNAGKRKIEKDWKQILTENGFSDFNETFYMKKYVRLLKAI